ncbi:uncharacterized protein Z520_04166 [Fonsecaea multimorphosa CBS 102226]|uniref:O-methyltransferase C-terminal domain-containing protein n=1 Tax=Fonsecaea multimorphosa CBS 102226 TaxID=1442371 RepID=A0A0D2HF14_9EURO|nr:uncharacterized protein Z520_04166 [Fonsecaea multimorphosa CBS 102226]KIY00481.1 hypothetical protein Z520_04166 [Fonsecaea multimorphosa CBS 102226]OAL26995.1 hypothetical protein AYO22_03939 [Fonsecaea multimorphosa]
MGSAHIDHRSLVGLAESIASSAKTIVDILERQKLPQPSFSPNSPMKYPEGSDLSKLQEARLNLITSAWAIEQLAAGPQDYIYWQAYTVKHDLTVLNAFARFGIFDAVPTDRDISYADLARKVPLTERQLRRLFRHAMTKNIFFEPRPDHVAHSSLSIAPVKNPTLKPWIHHNLGEVLPASSRLADAVEKYGDSQDPTATAFNMAWNLEEGKGLFDWLENDGHGSEKGWRARLFAQAMQAMDGGGHDRKYTIQGFNWEGLGEATVVDVGGSSGFISMSLAERFPALHFVVQDLPEVEDAFNALIPTSLKSRVTFQRHDFMTPQPLHNADVFLLRHVLHDWSDAIAIKILRNLINGLGGTMKNGARIIVSDNVMPPVGVSPPPIERLTTTADLQMWTVCNALERRKEDWIELFKEVDDRLETVAFVQPEGSSDTVIEVVFHDK